MSEEFKVELWIYKTGEDGKPHILARFDEKTPQQ